MPVLSNSKHEQFAQSVAKGVSLAQSYTSAGYSKASARQNAQRLITNEYISARINELKSTIAAGVVDLEIRNRSARIQVLQNQLDYMLNLQRARALLYADHLEGATGMVMKDYRGQKAQKEIWKFDAALMAQILQTLKQAAIEVGQWSEKRQLSSEAGIGEITRRLNAGRDRCAAAKRAADEKTKGDDPLDQTAQPQRVTAEELAPGRRESAAA